MKRKSDSLRLRRSPSLPSIALALVVALQGGCGRLGLAANRGDEAATKARAGDEQVALVLDGREISLGEVHEHMQAQFLEEFLQQPDDRQYEMREMAIQDLVHRHVIDAAAREKGVTTEALFEEIQKSTPAVTIDDVSTWYAENEARLQGAPLEQIAPQIEEMLTNERRGAAWREFVEGRLAATEWSMKLAPPRKQVEATRLFRGPEDAPVTLITFSDYQCPYCIRAEPVLTELLAKYPAELRVVHRHFPLDQIHPFARPAAEAAMCAEEQGKYWPFHDAIFARNGTLDEGSFAAIGKELGLDGKALETCIAERRHEAFVEADARAGQAAGVTGTPAYFVNGIPLKGARDVADLSRVIDAELARLAKAKPIAEAKPPK